MADPKTVLTGAMPPSVTKTKKQQESEDKVKEEQEWEARKQSLFDKLGEAARKVKKVVLPSDEDIEERKQYIRNKVAGED